MRRALADEASGRTRANQKEMPRHGGRGSFQTAKAGMDAGWVVSEKGCAPGSRRGTGLGQRETNVTSEPWSAVEWIADADLTRASFYWDSVPHCRNPPSACPVRGRAIPCSGCAKQRHDIIPNRLALAAEESVSGVTGATAQVNQETPPMRIYIIGNDGITLCREPAATGNKGEVAVTSREE